MATGGGQQYCQQCPPGEQSFCRFPVFDWLSKSLEGTVVSHTWDQTLDSCDFTAFSPSSHHFSHSLHNMQCVLFLPPRNQLLIIHMVVVFDSLFLKHLQNFLDRRPLRQKVPGNVIRALMSREGSQSSSSLHPQPLVSASSKRRE